MKSKNQKSEKTPEELLFEIKDRFSEVDVREILRDVIVTLSLESEFMTTDEIVEFTMNELNDRKNRDGI